MIETAFIEVINSVEDKDTKIQRLQLIKNIKIIGLWLMAYGSRLTVQGSNSINHPDH